MRPFRFAKVAATFLVGVMIIQLLHACASGVQATEKTRLTIATVNNGDMVVMQDLSSKFEADNPDIELRWVVLEENILRQRTTTDVASQGGQFDVSDHWVLRDAYLGKTRLAKAFGRFARRV